MERIMMTRGFAALVVTVSLLTGVFVAILFCGGTAFMYRMIVTQSKVEAPQESKAEIVEDTTINQPVLENQEISEENTIGEEIMCESIFDNIKNIKIKNEEVLLETNTVYTLPEGGFITSSGDDFLDITIKDGLIITGETTGNDYVYIADERYRLTIEPKWCDGPQGLCVFE